jgi:hypothetical protein
VSTGDVVTPDAISAERVLETKITMMIRKYRDPDHGTGGARRFKYRDVVVLDLAEKPRRPVGEGGY